MKKSVMAILLCLCMMFSLLPTAALAADPTYPIGPNGALLPAPTGSWTAAGNYDDAWLGSDPGRTEWVIEDEADLAAFARAVNDGHDFSGKTVTLNADLDMSGHCWTPIGENELPNNYHFKGVFNGSGKTISGLYYHGGGSFIGLFGRAEHAVIKQVKVINSYLFTESESEDSKIVAAGIVAYCGQSFVTGCESGAQVSILNNQNIPIDAGGIVGFLDSGSVTNCRHTGMVSSASTASNASNNVGGVAGASCGDIVNCCSTGDLSATGSADRYVGGVVGNHNSGHILTNCYSSGSVSALGSSRWVGGVVGRNDGAFSNCYSLTGCVVSGSGGKNGVEMPEDQMNAPAGAADALVDALNANATVYNDGGPAVPALRWTQAAGVNGGYPSFTAQTAPVHYTMDFSQTGQISWGNFADFDFSTTDADGPGWHWDASDKTLALDGLDFTTLNPKALVVPDGATIRVSGTNTVTVECSKDSAGIHVIRAIGSVQFEGGGALTAAAKGTENMYVINGLFVAGDVAFSAGAFTFTTRDCSGLEPYSNWGININGTMTVNSGTVSAIGGASAPEMVSAGISSTVPNHSLVIRGGGVVYASGIDTAIRVKSLSVHDATITGIEASYADEASLTAAGFITSDYTVIKMGADGSGATAKTAKIIAPVDVSFTGLSANGSAMETTTKLTLTFDRDVPGLTADDLTVTGAVKGALTKQSGTGVYTLAISGVVATGLVTVSAAKAGFAFTPASRETPVSYYIAPSAALGADKTVTVGFLYADADDTAKTDTIDILTTTGTDPTVTFAAADFSLSGSDAANTPIPGLHVTAIGGEQAGNTTLTISAQKRVTASSAYLWYKSSLVGQISVSSSTAAAINAAVSPAATRFDKYADTDGVSLTLSPGDYTLASVQIDDAALVEAMDYTVSGSVYTLSRDTLLALAVGSHTVTFTMSGGTSPAATLTVTDSAPITKTIAVTASPASGGTVSGGGVFLENASCTVTATPNASYTFVGWTENDVEVSQSASYTFLLTADRSLVAEFRYTPPHVASVKKNYTLRFDANGGSEVSALTLLEGTTVQLSAYAPTREGYGFTGWYADADLTNKITSVRLTGNTTVFAGWKPLPSMDNFRLTGTYHGYLDVNEALWYGTEKEGAIRDAALLGLMEGYGGDHFGPEDELKVSEAIKIACLIHSIYTGDGCDFTQGEPWYDVYIDYARENGIIKADDFTDYGAVCTRAQAAYILAHALPEAELAACKTLTPPDVIMTDPYGAEIYLLYAAGVLRGTDESGAFQGGETFTRGQAAAIAARMCMPGKR